MAGLMQAIGGGKAGKGGLDLGQENMSPPPKTFLGDRTNTQAATGSGMSPDDANKRKRTEDTLSGIVQTTFANHVDDGQSGIHGLGQLRVRRHFRR